MSDKEKRHLLNLKLQKVGEQIFFDKKNFYTIFNRKQGVSFSGKQKRAGKSILYNKPLCTLAQSWKGIGHWKKTYMYKQVKLKDFFKTYLFS